MRLTFKRGEKETGLRSIANPHADVNIKGDGKVVGQIYAPSRFGHDYWKVSLRIVKEATLESPTKWKWMTFKFQGASETEAREFVKKHWEAIVEKYPLAARED